MGQMVLASYNDGAASVSMTWNDRTMAAESVIFHNVTEHRVVAQYISTDPTTGQKTVVAERDLPTSGADVTVTIKGAGYKMSTNPQGEVDLPPNTEVNLQVYG